MKAGVKKPGSNKVTNHLINNLPKIGGLRLIGVLLVALFMVWQLGALRNTGHAGVLNRLDAVFYDWRFQVFTPKRDAILPIVIIDLDEHTQQREGRWPWDRSKVAALISNLRSYGAQLIGFDVVFSEPVVNPVAKILATAELPDDIVNTLQQQEADFDGDAKLAKLLDPSITLGFFLHNDGASAGELPLPLISLSSHESDTSSMLDMPYYTASLPLFTESGANSGFVVAVPDADGVIRRVPLLMRHGNDIYVSLTLELARQALGTPWLRLEQAKTGSNGIITGVSLGRKLFVPLDAAGNVLIPYKGKSGSYTTISATNVLQGDLDDAELQALSGSIILVGTSALGLSDLRSTPLQTGYPGVEAHANVLDALLQAALGNDTLYLQPDWLPGATMLLILAFGVFLAVYLPRKNPRNTLITSAIALLLLSLFNILLWHWQHLSLPMAAPLLLVLLLTLFNIISGYLIANRQRHAIQTLFGEYVPPEHVARMVENPDLVDDAGELRYMSVLFADVRNFTATSEGLDASALKSILNRYLSAVTEVIFANHGTVDKYIGDLVMAFWNAPLEDPVHPANAVQSALGMQHRLAQLRTEFIAEGLPALFMGIGINTGPMNVGDMGSKYRRAYTVLGDAVNLASRLESLTSYYQVPILVSDSVREQAPDFIYRLIDRVQVKGRSGVVEIYQPMAPADTDDSDLLQYVHDFESAIRNYQSLNWGQASLEFSQLCETYPGDTHICEIYLQRIAAGDPASLPSNWDAVFIHESK